VLPISENEVECVIKEFKSKFSAGYDDNNNNIYLTAIGFSPGGSRF